MGKYVVESEFEDLHGHKDDAEDLELDLSDSDNPIIKAALSDESWTPPDKDDGKKEEKKDSEDDLEDLYPQDEVDDEDEELEEDDAEGDDEDDEEERDDEDDTEEDDEDDDKYSKSVKKRIERERQLRQKEKAEADAKLRRMERKLELRDAKDVLRDFERETEDKLRQLRKKKVDAIEEGETETAVDIDDEILDLRAELKARKAKITELEASIDDDTSDTSGVPEAGRRWLEKYPEFHTNRQFNSVVLAADKMVASRGFDKNTDKYYAEIEKIVAVQFPKIVKKRSVQVTSKSEKRKKSAVAKTQKAGVTSRRSKAAVTRKGQIRLTKSDQQSMQMFGLDPRNPQHAKEWAANKTD